MKNITMFNTTASTSTDWIESKITPPSIATSTATNQPHVVMVQVKAVTGKNGAPELSASIDPDALARKLAIMRISAELDGRFVTSTAS